jgi:heat shock protein HtpX
MQNATRHRLYNTLQSVLLLGAMAALAGSLGWLIFGIDGVLIAAMTGALVLGFGPRMSPQLVLRLSGAVEVAPWQAPRLYRLLEELAGRAGLPRSPRLYYVPTRVLNAFATGTRSDAAIAVTDGMLRALDSREITGVLAHEVAHVRSNDVWVMTLADLVGRLTVLMSLFGQALFIVLLPVSLASDLRLPLGALALLIFAPSISVLLQLALSRTREYDADRAAVELTGDPRGLASALVKLERLQGGWMERMFMARTPRWLRTHPEMNARIQRLLGLEGVRLPAAAPMMTEYAEDPLYGRPVVVRMPRWHWHGLWH